MLSKALVHSPSSPAPPRPRPDPPRRSASLPPMPTPTSPRRRPAFHLAVDVSDPEEDRPRDPVADREAARRFHALSELLSTELGYLVDLRTLVSVYLRLLPVLKSRSSLPQVQAPSSNSTVGYFSRPPVHPSLRTHSQLHLNGATYVVTLTEPPVLPHALPPRTEKSRHLFSASDLDAITRNAEDMLELHERLVHQLRQVVSPFGISMTRDDIPSHTHSPTDIHRAIDAVSAVFVDHAASFDQYQYFCSGHSEAFDLVRKVQHRYPTEWDAFEIRCAAFVAEIQSQDVSDDSTHSSESTKDLCGRRRSFSSLTLSTENLKVPILSVSESGHTDRDASFRRPRLMFMDYMIKPVQRVCRYPLLFDQLQERTLHNPTSMVTQDAVKTALWTMRAVARLADEARRQQDLIAKSAQIVSRITQGLLASVSSHNRIPQPASLSSFLSSLGPCCLSGSLDVIHYRGTNTARLGTVRAKYLGAFLFPGGFLVLVKVAKSKAYEPKHWFNLRGFELVDSNLDDVLLPSWFRLSSKAHMFEFAASCRREKDIWVDAIRCAVAEGAPWTDEPPSSFQADASAPLLEDAQLETISPLPTIHSIPELDDVESSVANSGEPRTASQAHLRAENLVVAPSRRSSVTALPAPVPELNTFHLVRSTASAREQVDRGLLDIFSEKCLTARFHAHTREEDLFETQKVTRSFSRSASALTMASAMSVAAKNKLTKRESVFVPRKRSSMEGNGMLGEGENYATSVSKSPKKRQHPSRLKIIATKPTSCEGDEDHNEPPLDSPSPMSHCSSVSFVTPVTPLTIAIPLPAPSGEANSLQPHNEFLDVRQKDCVPKRSKSMIENVRGFFTPRSVSPATALSRESSARSSNSGLLKWWSKESLRRRVRSAPDVPTEEMPTAPTTMSLHVETLPRPSLATADRPYSQPDLLCVYSETDGSSTEFGVEYPRRRGVFSARGSQRRWTASALSSGRREDDSTPVSTRIRRNLSFLHRFAQNTGEYDDTTAHANDRS